MADQSNPDRAHADALIAEARPAALERIAAARPEVLGHIAAARPLADAEVAALVHPPAAPPPVPDLRAIALRQAQARADAAQRVTGAGLPAARARVATMPRTPHPGGHASPAAIGAAQQRIATATAAARTRQAGIAAAMRHRPAGSRVGK
jgi:hypothetical protein